MNAIEIADWISEYLEDIAHEPWGNNQIMMDEAQTMLRQQQVEVAELKNARDYWCLQYKDVFSKLERIANERCGGKDEDSSRHRNK